eukprot:gb/GFBE01006501.1/.p1 GENE.gb/GFBE01006501.1/~~gb/GFBE01006501.1/.p1  ORF type:complete len:402 (+),score=74.43 gb/GFBE01006501.1/:1-1206(+)
MALLPWWSQGGAGRTGLSLAWLLLAFSSEVSRALSRPHAEEDGIVRRDVPATAAMSTAPLMRRQVEIHSAGQQSLIDESVRSHAADEVRGPYFDLLILVPVNAKQQGRRKLIRETWGQYIDSTGRCPFCKSDRTVKLLFGTGAAENETEASKLEHEKAEFKDLAVIPSLGAGDDNYHNLTAKVRRCFKYAVRNFRFSLLLKADSDSFVFLDRVLAFAEKKDLFRGHGDKRPPVYAGSFMQATKPDESSSSKWADRLYQYRRVTGHDDPPKYAAGAGYMLSPSLCRFIADQEDSAVPAEVPDHDARWTVLPGFQQLANEDVSVGFWLQPTMHQRVEMPVSHFPSGCKDNSQVIDHHVLPKLMALRWETFLATGDPCNTSDVVVEESFEELVGKQLDTAASTS